MIKEMTMYTAVCDECGQQLNVGDEIIAWNDKDDKLIIQFKTIIERGKE